ncbi:phenylalanine--tRNA ligase subunit beta [Pleomorphomonas sp. NRK KF1]|uniref:phenylalanine--tRNA ligase subunit beta n=1 Tax=Pleomorphomonas sp. NRK KF1 TaxID=2943000 RepID=UPI00204371BB|nr:phenylalanine--tRNA ligase subunit beta [Pleomorphomonas sp. NRK KF1]MCM5553611.1 phenylalanine--tRNA ligase subunit beta [Pleomorphomonas sp. NRK KF1]
MKFTLSWLKDHLETEASLDEVVEALTMVGLEVEEVSDPSAPLKPFVVAKIVTADKHPNADKLKLLSVDAGKGPVQVVCGAPNARAGLKGVFALPGVVIPATGDVLEVGTIRGVESRGMMCSERELGLSDEHNGIIELPEDAPVGVSFADYRGGADPVIDISITPNRPDCLGVRGIARDLAARGLGKLKPDPLAPVPGTFPSPVPIALTFDGDDTPCPVFAGRVVRGLKNGPSPKWLQDRLKAIGLRPISALVDITNYITFDRGRPLHVYDADKLTGTIHARLGKSGESLLALDGKTYAVDDSMCVIADDAAVLGLGGVMGGETTGSTEATTSVFIESAFFDAGRTARTGRRLGLNSDARFRFERGIDPGFVVAGLELATRMVLDLCGGDASEVVVAGKEPLLNKVIDFPLSEVKRLSGLELPADTITGTLEKLGFSMSGTGNSRSVAVPSWRPDVHGKADLVEEVVRIVGLDQVKATALPRIASVSQKVLTPLQIRTRRAKRTLAARGLVEAVTWSFLAKPIAVLFGGGAPELELANPISADMSDMRPSLIPGLVAAVKRNADRGLADLALFEVGQVFAGDRPQDQSVAATAVREGSAGLAGAGRHWNGSAAAVSVYDAKADALALLDALGVDISRVQVVRSAPSWFHPGRSGSIQLGPQTVLAHFGELHPAVIEALDAEGPIVAAEVILDRIPVAKAKSGRSKPALALSAFMPVSRDFAFVVDDGVEVAKIVKAVQGADKKLIGGVDVFDIYKGEHVAAGQKSVAIAVTLIPSDRTLTDEDIEKVSKAIVAAVQKATGAALRG